MRRTFAIYSLLMMVKLIIHLFFSHVRGLLTRRLTGHGSPVYRKNGETVQPSFGTIKTAGYKGVQPKSTV
jgi:hypothetical protein